MRARLVRLGRGLGSALKDVITIVSPRTFARWVAGDRPAKKTECEGTWTDFLKRHSATLWAADFLSVKSFTANGVVDLYLLFFIHVGTRRVIISNPTTSPNGEWVTQQARNASMTMEDWKLPITHLILDHDSKFTDHFDAVFETDGAGVKRVGPLPPP